MKWTLEARTQPKHQQIVDAAGDEKADEPCVVVKEGDARDEAANKRRHNPADECNNRHWIEAVAVLIDTAAPIERVRVELCVAHEEVVGHHDARDWSQ